MAVDPYVYLGTDVLINRAGIRDLVRLRRFERLMTAQRIAEGFPVIRFDAPGFCDLHHHIFQDVYAWAGQLRTVEIAKPGALFCRPQYLASELAARFDLFQANQPLETLTKPDFADVMATHISELNAIHPFREGNGRVLRAFLRVVGDRAGHEMAIERIDPEDWHAASVQSFQTGDETGFVQIIEACLEEKRS